MRLTLDSKLLQLTDCLETWQQLSPSKPALWWQGEYISYCQLWHDVCRIKQALTGLGEFRLRVAVLAFNSPLYVALLYAVPAANQILLPLNVRLSATEWLYQLEQIQADVLIAEPQLLAALREHKRFYSTRIASIRLLTMGKEFFEWVDSTVNNPGIPQHPVVVDPQDTAWVLFTSGTTGHPKGAMLSQTNLLAGVSSTAHGRPVESDDHYLYPFPLFHVAAHNVLLQHQFGACVVLLSAFSAEQVIACCRELPISSLSLAPTMLTRLLEHPDFRFSDLDQVRTIGYGASAISPELMACLLNNTRSGLSQGYGMTELSGSIAFLDEQAHREALSSHPERLASVGKVVPGVSVKITDSGEIAVKARQVMSGYWQQEAVTGKVLSDGWLLTGDMGYFDDDDFLYIVDRKKDMIITGGENVASREVETVLAAHPTISQVAVVGIPDSHWGELVTAFVVLRSASPLTEDDLRTYCRKSLAGFKTPKRIFFTDTLAVNASGKVDKAKLRQQAETYAKQKKQ